MRDCKECLSIKKLKSLAVRRQQIARLNVRIFIRKRYLYPNHDPPLFLSPSGMSLALDHNTKRGQWTKNYADRLLTLMKEGECRASTLAFTP